MSTRTTAARQRRRRRSSVQTPALAIGLLLTVIGVLGFIPGPTFDHDRLHFSGPTSAATLWGVFGVSVLLNLIHLLSGVLGLAVQAHSGAARLYLVWGGGCYLALWFYGVAATRHSAGDFGPFTAGDNWLHLGVAVAMITMGFLGTAVDHRRGRYPVADPHVR